MRKHSKRLEAIVDFIPLFSTIADIGCDHGYVIIDGFLKRSVQLAQAIDNKEEPLQAAIRNIEPYYFYPYVEFTLSSGLTNLKDSYNTIIIAGMGGLMIKKILIEGKQQIRDQLFILQPNRDTYPLRHFLSESQFLILDEKIVEEDNKFYEIIVAKKSEVESKLSLEQCVFGPLLMKEKTPIFMKKWLQEKDRLKKLPLLNEKNLKMLTLIERMLVT